MRSFFKTFLASFLATLLVALILFLIVLGVIRNISSKFDDDKIAVKDHSVLVLNLNYPVPDKTGWSSMDMMGLPSLPDERELGLNDILKVIRAASTDDRIEGIVLKMGIGSPGYAVVEEVRDELKAFKAKDKFVIGYGEMINFRNYYLASAGDEIYVNPSGFLEMIGLSASVMFYKDLLDKMDVEMEIYYAGKFKGYTEPFRLNRLSDENREQISSVLNSLYDHILNMVGGEINMAPENLDKLIDSGEMVFPATAKQSNLITGIAYKDEVEDIMKEKILTKSPDAAEEIEDEGLSMISATDFLKNLEDEASDEEDEIAVLYLSGEIIDGNADEQVIGSSSFRKKIAKLRKSENIKAVVLRINSPGGSSLGSDLIYREIALLKEAKPVVVSMGNVAASGGYYIACGTNKIIAQPNTITGSIGVFFMMPKLGNMMENKLGITIDTVKTGPHADMFSPFRKFTDKEALLVQRGVDSTYHDFVGKVATGRNMPYSDVHEIAQGRVWTGLQALENGLVDQIGGIGTAIKEAAALAELEAYKVEEYPREKSFFEMLFGQKDFLGSFQPGDAFSSRLIKLYNQYKNLESKQGMQYSMPYILEIN